MGVIQMTLKGLEDIGRILNIMRGLECTKIEILKDESETGKDEMENFVVSVRFTMNDEEKKYVITKEGKKFRKYMLENSGIDIDEKLEWINKKMQGYIINFMDVEK